MHGHGVSETSCFFLVITDENKNKKKTANLQVQHDKLLFSQANWESDLSFSPKSASSVFCRPVQRAIVCVVYSFIYICLNSWLVTQRHRCSVRRRLRWFPFPVTSSPVPSDLFRICAAQTQNLLRDYISPLALEHLAVDSQDPDGRRGRMGFTSDLARVDMCEWIRADLWSKVLGFSPGGMLMELARSWPHFPSFFKNNNISL